MEFLYISKRSYAIRALSTLKILSMLWLKSHKAYVNDKELKETKNFKPNKEKKRDRMTDGLFYNW